MAAFTAHLLIGTPHPNDGGLNTQHTLILSEGDRPAWTLQNRRLTSTQPSRSQRIIWIPTLEYMLEDALLMITVHIIQSEPVRALFNQFSDKIDENRIEMYEDLNDEQRMQLYQACREIKDFPKVILCIFKDSYVSHQISALEKYPMECEVLMPVYTRLYSRWSREITIKGTLAPR